VPAVSRAGVAIGADGLILEVHPCPEKAVSDGAQSLTLPGFRQMMRDLQPYLRLWKESRLARMAAVAGVPVAV
jgi:3-deoxy-7-phosphoheptulonate synthase